MPLAVDLDENLIQMPAPLAGFHAFDPAFSDLVREHRPEPVPPESDGFVAYVHATLVKQILDIPQRKREPHIEHYGQADDFGARFEPLERTEFRHERTLPAGRCGLKASYSDRAREEVP